MPEEKYYNLRIGWNPRYLKEHELIQELGWHGACFSHPFSDKFEKFLEDIQKLKKASDLEIYSAAEITSPVVKNARKALDSGADLIFVTDGTRNATESWETDLICAPESMGKRDFMYQRNSGLDHIMTSFMTERAIGLEIPFSSILNTKGRKRATLMGRIKQNIRLARKNNTPLVITTGSNDPYDLRSPQELISFGKSLGLTQKEAKACVSVNPWVLLEKARKRNDPDVIMNGLKILEWGNAEKKENRKYGYY